MVDTVGVVIKTPKQQADTMAKRLLQYCLRSPMKPLGRLSVTVVPSCEKLSNNLTTTYIPPSYTVLKKRERDLTWAFIPKDGV